MKVIKSSEPDSTSFKHNNPKLIGAIIQRSGEESLAFFEKYINIGKENTLVISTTNEFNIRNYQADLESILNLSRVNNIRYINKFFEAVNEKLPTGGKFIVCFETITSRKSRHKIGKIFMIGYLWFSIEFVFLRVFPKVWGLKKLYFLVTKGRNRLLSKAEVLGRLVSCGFNIEDVQAFNGLSYAVCTKVKKPEYNMRPSYGPLFKMRRVGKGYKEIYVYKFRTMHPYAEYLQDYVLRQNGYSETGKIKNDFRLTPWGKVLRKYWIDELPQLINLFKGDLKLVGVRPVSFRYFQDIPTEMQELRLKFKPGCIPPYLALNRKSDVNSVLQAEKEYMLEKIAKPYTTDIRYFFMAVYNIVFRRKRSN